VIARYQVIVEGGDPLRVFQIDLPPDQFGIRVPPDFLESGVEYDFEVLAVEAGGNQTISAGSFETR
jgi:hypothetical protein